MSNRTTHILVALLTVGILAAGLALGPRLPEVMASHWNFQGQADGSMPRTTFLILVPAITAGAYLFLLLLIYVLPLGENVASFRPQLNIFFVVFTLFLVYVQAMGLAWNLGARFRVSVLILPGTAALFYVLGDIMPRAKRNWLFGIRTPWTLSSDKVWTETHRLGSWIFKASAVLMLLGVFLGQAALFFVLVPAIVGSLGTVVYSYLVWRREPKAS